jgi:hypothetical protein
MGYEDILHCFLVLKIHNFLRFSRAPKKNWEKTIIVANAEVGE